MTRNKRNRVSIHRAAQVLGGRVVKDEGGEGGRQVRLSFDRIDGDGDDGDDDGWGDKWSDDREAGITRKVMTSLESLLADSGGIPGGIGGRRLLKGVGRGGAKTAVMEVFSAPRAAEAAKRQILKTSEVPAWDVEMGWDARRPADRRNLEAEIKQDDPRLLILSPPARSCRLCGIAIEPGWTRRKEKC